MAAVGFQPLKFTVFAANEFISSSFVTGEIFEFLDYWFVHKSYELEDFID